MVPDRRYFAIQAAFAERWAAVTGIPLAQAYLECTTWYHQVGQFGRDFDATNRGWLQLMDRLSRTDDRPRVLHRMAIADRRATPDGPVLDYAWDPERAEVRLNFLGERSSGATSPLAISNREARRHELRELVARAMQEHPNARTIRGRSWLYSLEAYRRIFPPVFLANLAPVAPDLQFLACWGQFLDRKGRVRHESADAFLARLAGADTTAALLSAFPYAMLETRIRIGTFVSAISEPPP
jgi:hypothetical protein